MQDDVTYSMNIFDDIENLVSAYKESGFTYESAMTGVVNAIFDRQELWGMSPNVHKYDSANIMATFNIIWGE